MTPGAQLLFSFIVGREGGDGIRYEPVRLQILPLYDCNLLLQKACLRLRGANMLCPGAQALI